MFQVRDGVLAERHGFYLANEAERDEAEVTEEFLAQYYSAAPAIPRLIVVGPALARARAVLAEALCARRGRPGRGRVAERGSKRRLRELAERNAVLALAQDKLRQERRRAQRVDALSALQDALGLESLPVRIEGFDISNIGGEHTVASMVVFQGGAPAQGRLPALPDPRRPRSGPDDFASMEEVLSRRVSQLLEQSDRSPHDAERDESFAAVPDLIVIDGGKGQLSAGMKVLGPLVERGTAVIGLAKRLEEVYLPGGARAARDRRRTPRACGCCSGSATRRTGSRSTTTAAAAARR